MHHAPLLATICVGLVLAFFFGAIAHRLRISPLVGYLLAGAAVGPFTPGFVADQGLANQLAEIGVILLMFGVGLHFSIKDLLSVRLIAVPGAVAQIAVATLLGLSLALLAGWPVAGGVVFGLALSVASTVVLLRAIQERRLVETERGRIAVGWLIVEDLVMVFALVLIPVIAHTIQGTEVTEHIEVGAGPLVTRLDLGLWGMLVLTLGKVVAFVALMLVVGRRVIPRLLHWVAHTGSRELFRLAVLAIALGVAYGATALFDVSFALGAFFAGMILSESPLSQRAAQETLPLRDAFAVLFFISVGMLFDPAIVLEAPYQLLGTLLIILVGKSIAAYLIVRAFGRPVSTACTISASLAQIGEFSFILATLGVQTGLLPEMGRDLILAGAIISILLNPLAFALSDRVAPVEPEERRAPIPAAPPQSRTVPAPTDLSGHTVLVGYGRVGRVVGSGLRDAAEPFLVIEDRDEPAALARLDGAEVMSGNAADPRVLEAANLANARRLFVAIAQSFEAGQVVEQARRANPTLEILARAHSDAELEYLAGLGASETILGEREIARAMLRHAGVGDDVLPAAPVPAPQVLPTPAVPGLTHPPAREPDRACGGVAT
ncbi:YbaL family putative K(+) efflux transporter [Geminicoccus harenae]|uniref:YbaL family putative K(+) efflux transporter n=2 Tax=Geminicoccus harenae TaxID=2498453 RepID=UPI001C9755CD|nr:YbaL family putative K(+) efflux transporter [Geminicoccus harenae]